MSERIMSGRFSAGRASSAGMERRTRVVAPYSGEVDRAAPLWLSASGLTLGVGFAALAAEAGGGYEGVALLTGAAAAGGFGVFGLIERFSQRQGEEASDPIASFQAVMGDAPEIAALVDRSGRIRALNRMAEREAARRGLRPSIAADLLFDARDPQRAVFELLGAAFSLEPDGPPQEMRLLEKRVDGGAIASASPAGDGLALWRVRLSRNGEDGQRGAQIAVERAGARRADRDGREAAFEAAAAAARIAWFKVGPTGRIVAASPLFEEWTGPRAGRRPSLVSLFPELARAIEPGADLPESLVLPSRLIGAPGAPRAVTVALGREASRPDFYGVAVPLPEDAAGAVGLDAPPPIPLGQAEGRGEKRLSGRLLDAFDSLPAERVVSEAAIGVIALSPEGRMLRLNAAADRLMTDRATDRSEAAMVGPTGDHLIDWIAEEDREQAEARLKEAAAGGPSAFEARLENPGDSGAGRLVQCYLSAVDSAVGRILLCHMIDASEQRGLEQSFIQRQKLEAVGQLAGGVAHDFNNLLTVILGGSDARLRRMTEDDPAYEDLNAIRQAGRRAAWLVGQLLAFSRKQTLTPKVADLTASCSELVILLHRVIGERYEIVADLAEQLWPVEVDVNQFEQVITNLVVNASHAMKQGGEIRLTTANESVETPRAQGNFAMPAGDYVRVTVEDKGEGIAPEAMAKIFEPFFTTKPEGKGTGLGLAVVYGVVKQSNGFVFVDSEVGKGTVFTIYLPRLSEAEAKARSAARGEGLKRAGERLGKPNAGAEALAQAAPGGGSLGAALPAGVRAAAAKLSRGKRAEAAKTPESGAAPAIAAATSRGLGPTGVVLLVEDQAAVRAFAARMLAERGHKVIEAESGAEALEVLRDETRKIDLLLSDVVLEDMDGPSVLREIGPARPEMAVIFMSGYARDAFADTLESASAHAREARFLQKPFTLDELCDAAAEALAEAMAETRIRE